MAGCIWGCEAGVRSDRRFLHHRQVTRSRRGLRPGLACSALIPSEPDLDNLRLSTSIKMAPAATGGKKQKKKWSKGKVKDKAQHAVVLDKTTNDKLQKDVQSYRLITVATLVDRLKINGSLARKALADLEEKGQIKKVVGHSKLQVYTRAVGSE
ncbi:Ribosomal protein S25 [Lasiodiplodia theobromae]|nr:Ribosomal protein S25 [Lasiodiplodia theobromae]